MSLFMDSTNDENVGYNANSCISNEAELTISKITKRLCLNDVNLVSMTPSFKELVFELIKEVTTLLINILSISHRHRNVRITIGTIKAHLVAMRY